MIKQCRLCGESDLKSGLNLGLMPLVNSLLLKEQLSEQEEKFPLELLFCTTCSLVQLSETIDPKRLFDQYLYFSSFSDTMVSEARSLSHRLCQERGLSSSSQVIEIASNDGYLLQWYRAAGIPVLGIEPAKNIAEYAQVQKGIPTICDYFGSNLAEDLNRRGIMADVIHANNVMAHVPDINGFVRGISKVLKPAGIAVIEVPYAIDMVLKCEFDTIYHEHIFYFSAKSLNNAFERHGLCIQKIEQLPIHGGSLRVFVGHGRAKQPELVEDELNSSFLEQLLS